MIQSTDSWTCNPRLRCASNVRFLPAPDEAARKYGEHTPYPACRSKRKYKISAIDALLYQKISPSNPPLIVAEMSPAEDPNKRHFAIPTTLCASNAHLF